MTQASDTFIVRYWGVRGSIPTPGPGTSKYGGNTTCLQVQCGDTHIMIDSGTGARGLGNWHMARAKGAPVEVALIYSHLHLDHIQGFPFFVPVYIPTSTVRIFSAKPDVTTTRGVLQSQMQYPSFPVGLDALPSDVQFIDVKRGATFEVGEATVSTCEINHPGRAMAIRVDFKGHAFVQCSDIEHTSDEPDAELVALCKDADYLSFDATYIAGAEYEAHKGWGHSTWEHGLEVCEAANVKTFIAFHHDPGHNDDFMDGVARDVEEARSGSLVAREGMTFDLIAGTVSQEEQ